jgi:polysaccharide biosynthesis transport protein
MTAFNPATVECSDMAYELKVSDLKGIYRRRKKILLGSFAFIFVTVLMVAFYLPPVYQSQVMIFVDNQEIPQEFVQPTTAAYVSERLHVLQRQIFSPPRLLEIIGAHDLYPDITGGGNRVRKMRESILIEPMDVPIRERAGGRGGTATVGFTLSFMHTDPDKTAAVANILANQFIEEDRRFRESRAGTTTEFLAKELDDLRRQVRENEEKISRFRAANIDQLPGSTDTFQQMVLRLEQDIERMDARMLNLREKNVYLKSQIANIDPLVPIVTEQGTVAANPANRLKVLRLELIQKQSNLSGRHPDIIRLKSQIKDLEAQVGVRDTSMEKANRLTVLEKELVEAKAKYGDKHPDVARLSREADLLRRDIGQQRAIPYSSEMSEERSDNPGYMNMRAQIIVTQSEIDSLVKERARAMERMQDYQRRLEVVPFIDEQFNAMTLDYENAKRKFDEVSRNLHAARIAQEMDLAERGERFRINHPAMSPEKPFKPNRVLIILAGLLFGVGFAVGAAALTEGMDSSIKAADEMENVLGVPVLGTISLYDSPRQKYERRIRRAVLATYVLAFVLLASVAVDRFVMPLSDLWTTVGDRLVEMGVPLERNSIKS